MGLSATNKETQGFLQKKKQRDRAFSKKKKKKKKEDYGIKQRLDSGCFQLFVFFFLTEKRYITSVSGSLVQCTEPTIS